MTVGVKGVAPGTSRDAIRRDAMIPENYSYIL